VICDFHSLAGDFQSDTDNIKRQYHGNIADKNKGNVFFFYHYK